MSQQLKRHWAILRYLSSQRRPLTTGDIFRHLNDEFPASQRTYERDLVLLEDTFPQAIKREERHQLQHLRAQNGQFFAG